MEETNQPPDNKLDDTAYLSSSKANHERLIQAIRDIEAGENLQVVDIEEFD